MHIFQRTEMLIGSEALETLKSKRLIIFGVGGVGSFAAEALIRAGIGSMVLVDKDVIDITNVNRQIHALNSTVGQLKTDSMRKRLLDINPDANIHCINMFFLPDKADDEIFTWDYDYVIDAVDNVTAKIAIILKAKQRANPVISAMGAGNKLDPTRFKVTDIYKTSVCPLAKVMRKEMRKANVDSLKVVYSDELPRESILQNSKKPVPGSISFVPSVSGLFIASEVIKDILATNA